MNEADTCRSFVVPKLQAAGWDTDPQRISEQVRFTDGRIIVAGRKARRREGKRADYVLRLPGQTRLLVGPGFNYLARPTTAVWVTDEAPAHPRDRLRDGRCDLAFRFLAGPDKEIDVDLGAAMPVDLLSVHGHNLFPAAVTVELRSSRDNFGVDDQVQAVATIGQPSFATVLPTPVTRRFWRVGFVREPRGDRPGRGRSEPLATVDPRAGVPAPRSRPASRPSVTRPRREWSTCSS